MSNRVPILAAILFASLSATVPSAPAQVVPPDPGPTLESLHNGLQEMLQELDVSPIQMLRIRRIMLGELDQLDRTRRNNNLSMEQAHLQERAIQEEGRRQIDSILSTRQRQQLEEIARMRQPEKLAATKPGTDQK